MSTKSKTIEIQLPTMEEDRAIRRATRAEPNAWPLSKERLAAMLPLRGRPKSAARKTLVSIRYSPEVIAHFRATGDGGCHFSAHRSHGVFTI